MQSYHGRRVDQKVEVTLDHIKGLVNFTCAVLHEDLELNDLISLNITEDNNELVFTTFVKESVRTGCCCNRTEKRFLKSIVLVYEEIS